MKLNSRLSLLAEVELWAVAVLMTGVAPMSQAAATLWTGPNTNFTQSASSKTDVLIAGAVSISRDATQWLFNPAAGDSGPGPSTPTDTEWAFGSLANYATLSYASFAAYRNGNLGALIIGNPMVVHLVNQNIYLSLTFSAWGEHGAGGFAYTRSTPAAVAPAPTVTITNPANGAVFAAPASVKIGATATVASGSVTNVAFFAGTTLLGSAAAAPFQITSGSLAAANYSLSAVATAAGISATSSVVNISVISPVAVSNSAPVVAGSQFSFNYSASAGLAYVVQNSSNLLNWLAVATNVASSNLVHFTDALVPNGARYYRVGLLPNP